MIPFEFQSFQLLDKNISLVFLIRAYSQYHALQSWRVPRGIWSNI